MNTPKRIKYKGQEYRLVESKSKLKEGYIADVASQCIDLINQMEELDLQEIIDDDWHKSLMEDLEELRHACETQAVEDYTDYDESLHTRKFNVINEAFSANPDHIKIIGKSGEHKENGRGDYVTYIKVRSDAFDDDFYVTCYDYLPKRFYGEYVDFKPVIADAVWEFIKKERRKNKDLQSYISQNIDLINKLYVKKYGDVFESNK